MNRFHDGMSLLSWCSEGERGYHKYHVIREAGNEDLPVSLRLLFQEPKNTFLLRACLLFLGCTRDVGPVRVNFGITLYFHLIGNEREMGIAFFRNTRLLVMRCGWFRYGMSGGCWKTGTRRYIVPGFPVGIGNGDGNSRWRRLSLGYSYRCLNGLSSCLHPATVEWHSAAVTED